MPVIPTPESQRQEDELKEMLGNTVDTDQALRQETVSQREQNGIIRKLGMAIPAPRRLEEEDCCKFKASLGAH